MAGWGSGYVVDTAYVHDFCRVQVPPMLSFAALAGGVEAPGAAGEALAYCDLGCGQGYTANLIAAANPAAQVLGIDFNPSHIANARALATAARLSNVDFREASFEEIAADPTMPPFDLMAMHGVFGWVSARNRQALVELIGRCLKPGGLLYVSYDCMPGWAGVAPLRRIMARSFASRAGSPSPAALERAIAYSDSLRAADARFHRMFPNVEAQIERLKSTPRAYLAHELLTRDWEAFSFGQVADALAEAKLTYVGSAYLTDGVDRVNFTEAQQAMLAGLDDPILREETRDMLLARQFRRDVFAKGIPDTSPRRIRARWLDTRFAMTSMQKDFDMTFDTPIGKLQLRPDVHAPLIERLRKGPVTLREAIDGLPQPAANWGSIADAIKVLVGRGDLQPALPAGGDAARAASVRAFNAAVLERAMDRAEFGYLASPVTGGAVRVDRVAQLYLFARQRGMADPAQMLATLAQDGPPTGGGTAPSAETARAFAQSETARIEADVLPVLEKLGID
ncbi:MAG TPA: class I SAM-dependent methyltransferase [Xanthobacteraceae bacterium]|nr:class I SAM-dependent methyltransferase [Xanthobacteraceae bacterium]